MKLFTAEEMRKIDAAAIENVGIPGILLMESAGRAVVTAAEHLLCGVGGKRLIFFAGKGNNGGDAFAAARIAHNLGAKVKVVLVAGEEELQGDALQQLSFLKSCSCELIVFQSKAIEDKVRIFAARADLLVDGLLGTGFHGSLTDMYALAVKIINASGTPVLAVDLPSGIEADTGKCAGEAVRADVTVTMSAPKLGLYLYPGAALAGRLEVAEIGVPRHILAEAVTGKKLLTGAAVRALLPERALNAHKGTAGRALVVAGSPGFTGAAALAGYAAVKAGAGLVTLLTPLSSQNVLAGKLTEVMVTGLLERAPGVLGSGAAGMIAEYANRADAVAIGPGLGTNEATQEVIRDVLLKLTKPIVIDADALTALAGHTDILRQMSVPKILTPHPGEMARLTGGRAEIIDENRVAVAGRYADEWDAILVLKGAPTVVAWPGGQLLINTTGNEGMATGGMGDVLTGIIVALLAQKMPAEDAAPAGVYLHGLAGDLAAANGIIGLNAGQLCELLPQARQRVVQDGTDKNCNCKHDS